jgi:hypothetical protein
MIRRRHKCTVWRGRRGRADDSWIRIATYKHMVTSFIIPSQPGTSPDQAPDMVQVIISLPVSLYPKGQSKVADPR